MMRSENSGGWSRWGFGLAGIAAAGVAVLGIARVSSRSEIGPDARVQQVGAMLSAPAGHTRRDQRPIPARDDLYMENLTWMEVRDAVQAGYVTVIVPAGGIEQNGPYLATGKHNFILRVTVPLIAKRLGKTLIAPIVPFAPPDEPDGEHYAGTFTLRESTFEGILEDVAESLQKSDFENILLLGDSHGNQKGMEAVAARLTGRWRDQNVRVLSVAEYYDNPRWTEWLVKRGIHEIPEGIHDDVRNSSILSVYDPQTIRMQERRVAGLFSVNGIQLDPLDRIVGIGRELAEYQADVTTEAIRRKMAQPSR